MWTTKFFVYKKHAVPLTWYCVVQ